MSSLRVCHQTIRIKVDPSTEEITGSTDIDFEITNKKPKAIFLSARQMKINKISINGEETKFIFIDSRKAFDFNTSAFIRDSSNFAAVCKSVLKSPDIVIPFEQFEIKEEQKPTQAQKQEKVRLQTQNEGQTQKTTEEQKQGQVQEEYNTLKSKRFTVQVTFEVFKESTGIIRDHGIIFTDNESDGPSSWFPCIDCKSQRSTYTLIVTHPDKLVAIAPGRGTLIDANQKEHTNTIQFKIPFCVLSSFVGFALGPFNQEIFPSNEITEFKMYYLSDRETFLNTMKPIPSIFHEVSSLLDYNEPLFGSMSFALVPNLNEIRMFPGCFFFPLSMLLPIGNINVFTVVIPKLIQSMLEQFILFLFPIHNAKMEWIQTGFIRYFSDIIANKFFSECYQRDCRWNDLNLLYSEDIHQELYLHALDPATGRPFQDEYLKVKSKLLIGMLSQSIPQADNTHLLMLMRDILKKSEDSYDFYVEQFYERLKRFCPGIDFKKFREQWLEANGFPIFTFSFTKIKRDRKVRITIHQEKSSKTKVDVFSGQILAQLHDTKAPYNSFFSITARDQQQEIKYENKRFKTSSFRYFFQNNTSLQVPVTDDFLWISLDPDSTWICRTISSLPETMLYYQIYLRRDAFVQHEVISELERFSQDKQTINLLEIILNNSRKPDSPEGYNCDFYYGVRCHAARALAKFDSEESDHAHSKILFDWYRNLFLDKDGITPKRHDFENPSQHYTKLEVI